MGASQVTHRHHSFSFFKEGYEMREEDPKQTFTFLCVCLFYVRILHGGGGRWGYLYMMWFINCKQKSSHTFSDFCVVQVKPCRLDGDLTKDGWEASMSWCHTRLFPRYHPEVVLYCRIILICNVSNGHWTYKSTYSTWFNLLQQVFEGYIRPSFRAVKKPPDTHLLLWDDLVL